LIEEAQMAIFAETIISGREYPSTVINGVENDPRLYIEVTESQIDNLHAFLVENIRTSRNIPEEELDGVVEMTENFVSVALPAIEKAPLPTTRKVQAAKPKVDKPKKTSPKTAKGELRIPQIRILEFLSSLKGEGRTRKEISEGAPCDLAWTVEWLGSHDPEKRVKNDTKSNGFPSLVSLNYVRVEIEPLETKSIVRYFITEEGEGSLLKIYKEVDEKLKVEVK
jgi:hypothetical protein